MTDTSLPTGQNSTNDSYVDSYAPPNQANGQSPMVPTNQPPAQAATQPSTPAPTPATAAQPTNSSNKPGDQAKGQDPLAELEKALADYEAKQKATAQPTAQPTAQSVAKPVDETKPVDKEDPLAELERVLDEYEARYKQKQAAQAADKPGETITAEEYQSVLKNKPPAQPATTGESIEEQNIFELLGVKDAQPTEKEAFLDELQQALWDDFLEKDLPLLVNQDQLKQINDLQGQDAPAGKEQAQLIKKVEELVPDIEDIMLEKALSLKEEMVWERVAGMKEYYAQRPADLTKITEAEQQLQAGRWKSGSQLLNTLMA